MNNVCKWGLHLGLLHLWSTVWVYLDLRTLHSFVFVWTFSRPFCFLCFALSVSLALSYIEDEPSLLVLVCATIAFSLDALESKCKRSAEVFGSPKLQLFALSCVVTKARMLHYVGPHFFVFIFFVFFFSRWTFFLQFCSEVQGDIGTGLYVPCEVYHLPVPARTLTNDSRNTAKFMPYFSRT